MTWQKKRNVLIILMILYLIFVIMGFVFWQSSKSEKITMLERQTTQNKIVQAIKAESVDLIDELIKLSE
ncbi:hypothetical protein HC864_01300 [Candidatus Gracilibacteria bacterium]|nr:hypothetical protein [Candidatus Gracilibacteria bacterium]